MTQRLTWRSAALACLMAGCAPSANDPSWELVDDPSQIASAIAICNEMAARDGLPEALEWLRAGNGQHAIGEMTPDDSVRHVEDLYARGAVRVVVLEPDVSDGLQNFSTMMLAIEMPDDPKQRRALIEVEVLLTRMAGEYDSIGDRGQDLHCIWYEAVDRPPIPR